MTIFRTPSFWPRRNRVATEIIGDSFDDKKICGRREIYGAPPAIICGDGGGDRDEKEANNCVSLYHEHDAVTIVEEGRPH